MSVISPLIFTVEKLYYTLGQYTFKTSQKNNVVLPMIVDPALIAFT